MILLYYDEDMVVLVAKKVTCILERSRIFSRAPHYVALFYD